MRTKINRLDNFIDKEVTIAGFVDSFRDLRYVTFLVIRDITGKVQVTIEKSEVDNEKFVQILEGLTNESTVKITGILKENDKVKLGGKEIIPSLIEVTSRSKEELPIDLRDKDKALRETRLDYRFLDLRREENVLLFKVATYMEHAMREFWTNDDYFEIHSPKISGAAAESGAEVFKLDYFGTEACLSQSPQFYKQMAMSSGFEKVFEIGPAFRAEESHTSYHATEINMGDVEISFIDSVDDVMKAEEDLIRYTFDKINKKYGEEINKVFGTIIKEVVKIPKITFKEAKRILKEEMNYIGAEELDFERKEESLISDYVASKYSSDFVFITEYPFEARPFYHMLDEDGLTMSFDLIYKGLEITTGAQREHRIEILEKQVLEKGIELSSLDFYLDFFRYGVPPHGGFAIGIARILMRMFEIDNIREATFIYRGPNRLLP